MMSLKMSYFRVKMTYVRVFNQNWASTKKWSKNLKKRNTSSGNKKQEKLRKKRTKRELRSRTTQTCDNEIPGEAPTLAKVLGPV